ncbi:MAG: nucleotide exchange factor GrpE, partial [Ruminococcus sp.]|nr:nucleotide exchange factor GrpE [Ruminococcus sp.]
MSEKNKAEIPEEEIQAEQTVEEVEAEAVDAEDIPDERDEKIGKLEAELAAQKDRYMRLAAEYDNYRKRTANEKLGIYDDATSKAVTEIL